MHSMLAWICYGFFLLSDILLCLSSLLCIGLCGAPSPDTVFRLWQMCYIALGNYLIINMIPSPSHFVTLGCIYAVEKRTERLDVLCTALVFAVCGIDTDIKARARN